jgi:hypothetical protein
MLRQRGIAATRLFRNIFKLPDLSVAELRDRTA